MKSKNDRKILIDWLTFTVGVDALLDMDKAYHEREFFESVRYSGANILEKACGILGLRLADVNFLERRGWYGYEMGYVCGGIRICYGGCDTVMVDLSGEGCRLVESLAVNHDWLRVIQRVQSFSRRNFSRLDIACDTFGTLKMSQIFKYVEEFRYISRWKMLPRIVKGREETVDFGSPKSRTMLRIYNKSLERRCKVDDSVEVPEDWVRCELQLRNDAVDSFLREWVACQDVSKVYFGIMANQLRFVKSREKNLARSVTVAWWRRFLDNSAPIRLLYNGGLAYNLQSLEKYLYGQAGSSMKAWLVLSDWDVDTMLDMVARRKVNDRQQALISVMSTLRKHN